MKIKQGFLLRSVADHHVVIPVGSAQVDFGGMISLNEVGAFLWERLAEERSREELLDALLERYQVDRERAAADLDAFLVRLRGADLLEKESF